MRALNLFILSTMAFSYVDLKDYVGKYKGKYRLIYSCEVEVVLNKDRIFFNINRKKDSLQSKGFHLEISNIRFNNGDLLYVGSKSGQYQYEAKLELDDNDELRKVNLKHFYATSFFRKLENDFTCSKLQRI